jgi:NAD(P)-dependent dehydrogenase (short-subunit alcohol dehydrogenase family)
MVRMKEDEFTDKVTLITGGGSGIGRACAVRMATHGSVVVVADLDESAAQSTVQTITSLGKQAHSLTVDVRDWDQVNRAVKEITAGFGGLHLAVNCAGIPGPVAPLQDLPVEDFDRVIETNLKGTFYSMRAEIPAITAAGGGSIINLSSIAGQAGFPMGGGYSASKHAIIGLTKTAALECAPAGIRVNVIAPGVVDTPMMASVDPAMIQGLVDAHPAARKALPDEIAGLVTYLSSSEAGFITGSVYPIDGGYLTQ